MNKSLSVFCDFDGTVTRTDVVDFLLQRLALPEWQILEAQWERGEINSRECMAAQIPLLQGGWDAIETALNDVDIDPTFPDFVAWCRTRDVQLVLVSEGLDRVIHSVLKRYDIVVDNVWANRLEESADGCLSLSFPFMAPPTATGQVDCGAGLCKCLRLSARIGGDARSVVIGDGASDYCWSHQADILFTKHKLTRYAEQHTLTHQSFTTFAEIQCALEAILSEKLVPLPTTQPVPLAATRRHYA